MNSIAAKDNKYSFIARMFPDNPPFYQSALFVKTDSPINSINDLKPSTIIAMGAIGSASSFFMPSYDLYGKTLTVIKDNRGSDIIELVKSDKADIGSGAVDFVSKAPEIRVVQVSRNIPGAGVYLSPNLSEQDRQSISKALLNAPKDTQKMANYGEGEEPDYSAFNEIVRRVEEILSCSDFSKNPVNFYCPESKLVTFDPKKNLSSNTLVGKVNGYRVPSSDTVWLNVEGQNGIIYKVIIPKEILNQIPNAGSPLNLQNKKVEIINVNLRKLDNGNIEISIDEVKQFRVL
jgi:serine/threonine-protein kinase